MWCRYCVQSHCLIFSPVGGSHYLLLDEISQNLHQHGHEVRMLLQLGNPVITGTYLYMGMYSLLCITQLHIIISGIFQVFPMWGEWTVTRRAHGRQEITISKNTMTGFWSNKHSFYWEGIKQSGSVLVCFFLIC